MGLYTPAILGGNSYLSWFYDRGAIKDPAHTGTSKGLSQTINRGPIRKFLPNYANVYVTIQSHALSAGVRTHYVTANGVRDGLPTAPLIGLCLWVAMGTSPVVFVSGVSGPVWAYCLDGFRGRGGGGCRGGGGSYYWPYTWPT